MFPSIYALLSSTTASEFVTVIKLSLPVNFVLLTTSVDLFASSKPLFPFKSTVELLFSDLTPLMFNFPAVV